MDHDTACACEAGSSCRVVSKIDFQTSAKDGRELYSAVLALRDFGGP